jgi:cytochrome c553
MSLTGNFRIGFNLSGKTCPQNGILSPPMDRFTTKCVLPICAAFVLGLTSATPQTDPPPPWAYPMAAADYRAPVDDGTPRHVPGSSASWTLSELSDRFFAPDWHPEEHLRMPEVVAHGRKPDVFACGYCHRAEGTGGPENANIAGLPEAYIVQQMADFKSGARKSSVPHRSPAKNMTATAKAASDAEVVQAAAYFSSIKPRKLIIVVEAQEAPKSYVASAVYARLPGNEKEPIAGRILEMPKDLEQFESRDTHSEFIAYVPPGSLAEGKTLATTGAGKKTTPCVQCHGADLRGLGSVPGIAGRSPSYLMRQLYDMKHGARAGAGSQVMKPVLADLTDADFTSLAAYAASLNP